MDKIEQFLGQLDLAETYSEKYMIAKRFTLVAFAAGMDKARNKKTGYNLMHRMLNMLKPFKGD